MSIHLSREEQELSYKYIVLPLVKKVLEKDLTKFESIKDHFKFGETYVDLVQQASLNVSKEMSNVKYSMKKIGLTVYQSKSDEMFIKYDCFCRIGKCERTFLKTHLKNMVDKEMRGFFNLKYVDVREGYDKVLK